MPYLYDKDDLIPRVTEVASALQCEMTAWLNPVNKKERDEWEGIHSNPIVRYNLAAVAGTIVHDRIETFLRELIGIPAQTLVLSKADQAQIKALIKKPERYRIFLDKIEKAFNNFLQFWNEYKDYIRIIAVEKKIRNIKKLPNGKVDPYNSLAGTIDLLALYKTEHGWRLLIIDWKSGSTVIPSHYLQLSGYYNPLLVESEYYAELAKQGFLEKYPYYIEDGKPQVLCVLLGASKYKAKWYSVNVNDFRKAQKKFRDPRPLPINTRSGHVGLTGGICAVCEHILECGEYLMGELEIPVMKDESYTILDEDEMSVWEAYS